MKNLLLLFVLLIQSNVFGQNSLTINSIDTIHFAADSSYSRALIKVKNSLYFGTSKNGVVKYDLETKNSETIIPANEGEFRDLNCVKGKIFAIESGDNGVISTFKDNSVQKTSYPKEFFDDICSNKKGTIILADPIGGNFTLHYIPSKKGKKAPKLPKIRCFKNEACFAASGTTAALNGNQYSFVSGGGKTARFHSFVLNKPETYFSTVLPLQLGESAGPYSLLQLDETNFIAVGGDYTKFNERKGTCAISNDGGKTWKESTESPNGYRSCVVGTKELLFCCGTNGIDYSLDGGNTWKSFKRGNFCALLLDGKTLYATTNKGYCLRYNF